MAATARIEVRVTPETKQRLRRAAELDGRSLSGFIVAAAEDRAGAVPARNKTTVDADYFAGLLASLDEPAEPSPALQEAFRLSRSRAAQ